MRLWGYLNFDTVMRQIYRISANTNKGNVDEEVDIDLSSTFNPIIVQYLHQYIKDIHCIGCLVLECS